MEDRQKIRNEINRRLRDIGLVDANCDPIGGGGSSLPAQAGHAGEFLTTNGAVPSWMAIPGGGDALTANPLSQFAATTSAQLASVITNETGTGLLVFNTSPTLITPALGTPTALVGTNITGTAAGLTAGTVTTNANLTGPITSVGNATSVAVQTGTGSVFVMNLSPTLVTPVLGVAAATSINKITITAPATGSTLTIDDGFTLHATGNVTALSGSHTGTSSGTNTGDQTSIVGITGTKAQFNTAVTDGDFLFVGDVTANVTKVGTPVNDQIGVWTGDGTIEGDANLTWTGLVFSSTPTSATTSNVNALYGKAQTTGSGTISSLIGVRSEFTVGAASTVTAAYGLKVEAPTNAGTLTDTYGVHIGTMTVGTQTNTAFSIYASDTSAYTYLAGRLGAGTASPTAQIHVAAGTTSLAPFKFTSGTNLTTPAAGAVEWNGTNLFVTQTTGPTRKTIAYTTDIPASNYSATAFTAQTSVTVTHSFGAYPLVQILDNTAAVIIPLSVTHASVNAFTVTFTSSTTGTILARA